jgi:predicted nuclease with TOPRIM domain
MTTKIVDVLRKWKNVDTEYSAVFEEMKDLEVAKWDDDMRESYLRGYDDRQPEIDALAARLDRIGPIYEARGERITELENETKRLTARVRELEATRHRAVGEWGSRGVA